MKNNELNLVVPQFHSITRSFDRKLQVKQFEPISVFSSHNEQIPIEDATPDRIAEVSARLFYLAKQDVETDINNYLNAPAEDAFTQADLDKVAPFVKMLALDIPKDDISKKIVEAKEDLSERQKVFLRNLIKCL